MKKEDKYRKAATILCGYYNISPNSRRYETYEDCYVNELKLLADKINALKKAKLI